MGRSAAGRGTRFGGVPFRDVISARVTIIFVVPAAGGTGRLVSLGPIGGAGISLLWDRWDGRR